MKLTSNLSSGAPSKAGQPVAGATLAAYWSLPPEQLFSSLHASKDGLQPVEAEHACTNMG